MARKRKNYYFTLEHEQAIINYCLTEDSKIRNELYKVWIGPVFDEMVDKIVYTYRFTTLPNIDALRDDCKNWLITILDKYDASKGSKAFTYFSVVTKNWFIHQVKKTSKKAKREVLLEDYFIDSSTMNQSHALIERNTIIEDCIKIEFFTHLKEEVDSWHALPLKPNEKKTVQAIQVLFDESEKIDIFNKKAIYLYIREITGLNTKQVVSSLNRIRRRYREFKKEWDEK